MKSSVDHDKVECVRLKNVSNKIVLDLPFDTISGDKLPSVTVITITKNRKEFSPLMIDNWKRIYYPHDKLSWLIVDDSEDIKQGPVLEIKALKDKRVMYYYSKDQLTIGAKRNLAMSLITTELVVWFDDDDFFYDESIISRVCALKFYQKECVYCPDLQVYSAIHESSYVLEAYSDVPEGTMLFTKKFWENSSKFADSNNGEGIQLVKNRELSMLRIPSMFVMVVINHKKNTTGNCRNMKFKFRRDNSNKISPINFMKEVFPTSFKNALKEVIKIN